MTCAAALSRSGRSPESCGMRMPARIASTAIVSSTSISVRAGRRRDSANGWDQTGPGAREQACPRLKDLVQSRLFDRGTGIGGLGCAAAEQVVLLLQQLLDFAQLANLVLKLFDLIGVRRLTGRGRGPERSVKA